MAFAAGRGRSSSSWSFLGTSCYEFALASAAAAVVLGDDVIRWVRVGLGGVATVPWRAVEAEAVLTGSRAGIEVFTNAARAALAGAEPHPQNAFKVELAQRTLVRSLQTITGVSA
ncbi:hypothetical protein [Streptomyces sp. NEAU-YJ-81]|uniref:hypothetical protein n=1 Tax=Streptomyces sp. NEAU-YJ-81 TaxID=2820288 RepID=UPI001FBA1A9A